jgi:serine/threonine-protein kinase
MTPERWHQIEALFHTAHALPAHERAAFLAGACPGDERLHREVERLLSEAGSDEEFLAGRAAAMAVALPGTLAGRTLGGYRLEALIGAGGMGEVYRARDDKLGRDVAIKVLPHAFTSDPARLARLEREARTLAALNHPNICGIYGFEEAEQVRYLILELVDGDTLDDRLAAARQRPDGPGLPQREALHVGRQIARALDFAHQRGVVHRDLKPANIKVTAAGEVKVLDFGLAKAAAGDAVGADLEQVVMGKVDATIEGTIVGTPAYMSPEQARGKPIDKRADVWAFGCVLYEMLTGRSPFSGDSVVDTIARLLQKDPDWTVLPQATPTPIRSLLIGCLAKDSRERLRDIGDVRITIDSVLSGSSGTMAVSAVAPARARTARTPWALVGALTALVFGMVAWSLRPQPPQPAPPLSRWTVQLPEGQALDGSGGAHVATITADGTQIAYAASPGLLYLRLLSDLEAKPIQGIEAEKGVREPTFRPDGQEIAFYSFDDKALKRKAVSDASAAVEICPADTPTGIEWWAGGILFGQGRKGIYRVSPNGGQPEVIAQVGDDEEAHGPHILPDGEHFLFTIAKGGAGARDRWDKAQIVVQSLETKARKTLRITGSDARYVSGYLLYAVSGRVYAVAFDLDTLEADGTSVLIQEGVSRASGAVTGAANFSVSDNGVFVYVPGPVTSGMGAMEVSLIDPKTEDPRKLSLPADSYVSLRVSPDESRIAFGNTRDKESTIYTYALPGPSTIQPLTTSGAINRYPAWTPDSKRLAFQSNREGNQAIWWQAADGTGEAERLTRPEPGESHIPESWSASGTLWTLLYSVVAKDGRMSLWALPVRNGQPGQAERFGASTSTDPMSGAFSPDGTLVAYTLTELGTTTVCVQPFPAASARECVRPAAATDSPKHPRWWPDGTRVFYDPRPGDFESVSVVTRPKLRLGSPTRIEYHPFQLAPPGARTPYDITRSGKYLGLTTPGRKGYERQTTNTKIQVVLNWFEVLKEKLPR